jgi:hypothetical protein
MTGAGAAEGAPGAGTDGDDAGAGDGASRDGDGPFSPTLITRIGLPEGEIDGSSSGAVEAEIGFP